MSLLDFLMALVPLLGLVCLLLAGHYPGEAFLERLRLSIEPVVSAPARLLAGNGPSDDFELMARGTSLLACFLAGRAPPLRA